MICHHYHQLTFPAIGTKLSHNLHLRLPSSFRCNLSLASNPEPEPVYSSVKSFAPATVTKLSLGFDFLGCAVDGIGDYVTLKIDPQVQPGDLEIPEINSANGPSKIPSLNCAGMAANSVMKMLNIRSVGLSLSLEKGLPLGGSLGSSAASAAAAAVAVNELFGGKLAASDLVLAGIEAEAKVSGYHADNIAAAIMGGLVLIGCYDPLDLIQLKLPTEKNLWFVLVTPNLELPKKMREAWPPTELPWSHFSWDGSHVMNLTATVLQGDLPRLGKTLSFPDKFKEAPLIPGMGAVKEAALEAGALGCMISGDGPTVVAVTDDEGRGVEIGEKMVEAFMADGNLKAVAMVNKLDRLGARIVKHDHS